MTDAGSAGEDLDRVEDRTDRSANDRAPHRGPGRFPDRTPDETDQTDKTDKTDKTTVRPPDTAPGRFPAPGPDRPKNQAGNRAGNQAGNRVGHRIDDWVDPPAGGGMDEHPDHPADHWQPEPERPIHRGWLVAAMVAVVIVVGTVFVTLVVGGDAVDPADPARLSAPVTLPASIPPAPKPPQQQPPAQTGTDGDICPGSEGVSADDQPGWAHATVQGPDAACEGRYSLHTTSEAGGVFYRWISESVQAGSCDIAVYIPDTVKANVTRVSYSVLDGDRLVESFVIAQANHHGEFVHAGTYPAGGGQALTVRMDNRSSTAGTVVASAVRITCHQA